MNRVRGLFVVLALVAGVLSWLPPAAAFPNAADESNFVQFSLEACRLSGGTTLPIAGKFICPDSMYVPGNLGKSWNELDLVPHRLTTASGTQSNTSTTYKVSLAADGITNGKVGYDVLSAPELNAAKSHSSCTVSSAATTTLGTAADPFGGGTDTVIYRDVTIHQDKGTTCVIDWYQRLALTSHLYSGSSLQSYMFPAANLSGSKKTISIPVNEIEPQSLSKDMAASQTQDYVWNITKSASPTSLDFTNTCSPSGRSANVAVTISWTRTAANPSAITIITHVYATNPSARPITTTVTDRIYTGSTQTTQVTPTKSASSVTNLTETVVVPAGQTVKAIDFTGTVPAGTAASFNNVATGSYVDEVSGVDIPQTTSASSDATVTTEQGSNGTATISDTESIDAGFHFKVNSTSGASGSFGGGYTLGTSTTGPVSWTSASQTGNGSVTFNKTVTVDSASVVTAADDKALSDTATVTGAGGFSAQSSLDVGLTTGATISVGVNKNMQGGVTGTQTFAFDVSAGSTPVDTITIPITPPALSGSGSLSVAATGTTNTFTVAEQPSANWAAQPDQEVTVTLPSCTGFATFNNTFGPATAKVQKVTVPAGNEAGWAFTLNGPGTPSAGETVTTTSDGYVNFTTALEQGDYTITEADKTGFDFTSTSGDCSFSVVYPDDADRNFACTFTNTERGSLEVTKTVDWNGVTPDDAQSFEICITGPSYPSGDCKTADYDGATLSWTNVLPGDYTVSETDPNSSWTVSGDDGDVVGIDPGEAESAQITNTRKLGALQVTKSVNWNGITPDESKTFEICITGPTYPNGDCKTADHDGATLTWSNLIPGDYTATETDPGDEWSVSGSPSASITVPADGTTASFVPVITNTRKLGSLQVTKTVDWNGVTPVEDQTFEICITGASYPSGDCKDFTWDDELVQTWTNLIPGTYLITETTPGSSWTTTADTSATVPTNGGQATAGVTNTRKLGSLQVTKSVDWNGVTPDESKKFEICITGPSYPSGDCQTADYDGATLTWSNLIPGDYVATETDPGDEWSVVGSPTATIVVPSDGTTASFVPVISNTRKLGSLQVTKTVDWNGVTPFADQSFEICITGPSYPDTPNCKDFNWDDELVQTWTNLIPGTYTITETGPSSAWIRTGDTSATVPVDGGQAGAGVTNTRKLGSLQVTKTVEWNGVTPVEGQTFEICITGASYPSGDCKDFTWDDDLVQTWTDLIPGTYTITETGPGSAWTRTGDTSATVPVDGGQAAAGVTNTRKLGSLQVTKTVDWSGATPDTGKTFEICITGASYPSGDCKTVGSSGGALTWSNLIPGSYAVSETNPGIEWTVDVTGGPATVPTDGGQATASITNTLKKGQAKVVKTVKRLVPAGTQAFTFQLRTGATTSSEGTVVETHVANATNGGVVTFTTALTPGATYQLCEANLTPGWSTSLTGFVPNSSSPNVDNSVVCMNFTAVAGETTTITVDNTPPPEGRAHTIGFWKNWASCTNSSTKKKPVLDQTLAKAEPTGIVMSSHLVLHSGDCAKAVALLNKSNFAGKKMASDPAFNMAAQLLAAQLNYVAGAEQPTAATNAITQAVALLSKYKFTGAGYTGKISATDAAAMNALARVLDDYNNNRL